MTVIGIIVYHLVVSALDYADQANWGGSCQATTGQSPLNLDSTGSFSWTNAPSSDVTYLLQFETLNTQFINSSNEIFADQAWGKTIKQESGGNTEFSISSVRIHTPSEHQLSGTQYDLEVQIIHTGLILSILYSSSSNTADENQFLNQVISSISSASSIDLTLAVGQVETVGAFITYTGSETTPDCNTIDWVIWTNDQKMINSQLLTFQGYVTGGSNKRDLQDPNNRAATAYAFGDIYKASLIISTFPGSITANQQFTIVVEARDVNGDIESSIMSEAIIYSTNCELYGTLKVTAVSGVATFSDLYCGISGQEPIFTVFSVENYEVSQTASFTVLSDTTASRISIQPVSDFDINATASIEIRVYDEANQIVTSFNGSIAISVDSDNPNASYTIPTSVNASSGVANLSFSSTTVGTYTIQATAASLSDTSNWFNATTDSSNYFIQLDVESNTVVSYDKFYIIATIRYPTDLTTAFDGYTIELSSSNGGLNGVTSSKTVDGKVIFDNLDLQYDLNVHTSTVITATCIDCGFMSNNTSQITINLINSYIVIEPSQLPAGFSGSSFDVSVHLTRQPTDNVVIEVTPSDVNYISVSPTSGTFTNSDYNTPQTFTIQILEEAFLQFSGIQSQQFVTFNAASTNDKGYETSQVYVVCDEMTTNQLQVTIYKENPIYIEVKEKTIVTEGEMSYQIPIKLSKQPGVNAKVLVTSTTLGISPSEIYYNDSDFNNEKQITISTPSISTGLSASTINFSIVDTSGNQLYHTSQQITVLIIQQVTTQENIVIQQSSFPVLEEGQSTSYSLTLVSVPTENIQVQLSIPSDASFTISPTQITFSSQNQSQSVQISHQSNGLYQNSMIYTQTILHTSDVQIQFTIGESLQVYIINPCNPGQWSEPPSSGQCVNCPAGFQCPSPSHDKVACDSNTYSLEGTPTCDICPGGNQCTASTITQCATGQYSLPGDMDCHNCPRGSICQDSSNLPQECPLGTYNSSDNSTQCLSPSVGDVALAQDSDPITCPSGQYVDFNRCRRCLPGFKCPDSDKSNMVPCQFGHYSPGDQNDCTICPAGHFCSRFEDLGVCQDGSYSLEGWGICAPCPYNSICSGGNITLNACDYFMLGDTACRDCPVNYQCITPLPPVECGSGQVSTLGQLDCTNCSNGQFVTDQCNNCPSGYYCPNIYNDPLLCPLGTYSTGSASNCSKIDDNFASTYGESNQSGQTCQYGFTCATLGNSGGIVPQPCQPGTKRGSGDGNTCVNCLQGFYCPVASFSEQSFPCPPGYYCQESTSYPSICPAGKYQPNWKATSNSDCQDCSDGYYCPQGSRQQIPCPSGYYCNNSNSWQTPVACNAGTFQPDIMRIDSSACKQCPQGYYCPQGSSYPEPCPSGTYGQSTNLSSENDCTTCPEGKYCPLYRMIAPYDCKQGFYCPSGATFPTPCNNVRKINDSTNLTSNQQCQSVNCPAGFQCVRGASHTFRPPSPCPKGYYCEEGQSAQPCPAGTYSNKNYLKSANECSDCPAGFSCIQGSTKPQLCGQGHYCPIRTESANQYPCPNGTFSNKKDLKDVSQCNLCLPGHYCSSQGATAPQRCSINQYQPDYGQTSCKTCSAGYYCPGSGLSYQLPCPKGYFSASSSNECTPCTKGHYCPTIATTETQKNANLCPAGLHCPEGMANPNNIEDRCEIGHYCIPSNPDPIPCPTGTLRAIPGAKQVSDCEQVEAGYYTVGTGNYEAKICPKAYYCDAGTGILDTCSPETNCLTPCPKGTFRRIEGARSASECTTCPAGYFCSEGSSSPTICTTGHYCSENAPDDEPVECPEGTYNPDEGMAREEDCTPCPPGKYCSGTGRSDVSGNCQEGYWCKYKATVSNPTDGITGEQCPAWGYCVTGTPYPEYCGVGKTKVNSGNLGDTNDSACQSCPQGKYCIGQIVEDCAPGFYCTGGAYHDSQNITQPGFYSQSGASQQEKCSPGTYNNAVAQSQCKACPKGFYCENEQMTVGVICDAGHYCPLSSQTPTPCPPGTYSKAVGLTQESECTECPNGFACPTAGLSDYTLPCEPGYWCFRGAMASSNLSNTVNYGVCPPGHYCPQQTADPMPCPIGKFNSNTGSQSDQDCEDCTAGSYCAGLGLSSPTGLCFEGFYCTSGSSSPTQKLCSEGHYCPEGSSQETPCNAGTYQPNKGQATCMECPQGFYCEQGTIDYTITPCQPGYYCAGQTQALDATNSCPIGTYNENFGSKTSGSCIECEPGHYCDTIALTERKECLEGFYCRIRETQPNPQSCSVNYYCPAGSTDQIECSAGKLCTSLQLASPDANCPEGSFCLAGVQQQCDKGYYCQESSPSQIPCPAGTFNPNTAQANLGSCQQCTQGYYCEQVAQFEQGPECVGGWICPAGSKTYMVNDNKCLAGFECPNGSWEMQECSQGTYQNSILKSSCDPCPAGYYCNAIDSTARITPVSCPTGHYCLESTKQANQYPCNEGTYNPKQLAYNEDFCLDCPAGKYCSEAQANPNGNCQGGYYCPPGQSVSNPASFICPRGSFCPEESTEAFPCTPGKACTVQQLSEPDADCQEGFICIQGAETVSPTDGITGRRCKAGHYCPTGAFTDTPCPIGTYSNNEGNVTEDHCNQCDLGYYCDILGATEPTGQCDPGFYCPTGQKSSRPATYICSIGTYCEAGSTQETACPPGTYNDIKGQSECFKCPAGFYCEGAGNVPIQCDEGYYCQIGSSQQQLCQPNTFNRTKGQSQCLPCPRGFICEGSGTQTPVACPASYYCEGGDTGKVFCPEGTYSEIQELYSETQCKQCPSGQYCSEGKIVGSCNAGYYCISGNNTPDGSSDIGTGEICPIGHYCVEGAKVPSPCIEGKITDGPGKVSADDCINCTAGYYCIDGEPIPYPCPIGSYCPEGSQQPIDCQIYEYSPNPLQSEVTACQPCPGGYTCSEQGVGDPTRFPCFPGYYCPGGDEDRELCPAGTWGPIHNASSTSTCLTCPAGNWCGEGTVAYEPCEEWRWCPDGTQTPNQDCEGGQYCHYSTQSPTQCPAGYYCPRTNPSSVESPPLRCPVKNYCPEGSAEPTPCPLGSIYIEVSKRRFFVESCALCPAGSYSSDDQSQCQLCSAGYVCLEGATSPEPTDEDTQRGYICPPGYYCPEGSGSPTPCPKATYNDQSGGTSEENCKPCVSGSFDDLVGQAGCFSCGPNANSSAGSLTCECDGDNRAYMKRDATCRCKPQYQYFMDGITKSSRDSGEDCVPVVYDNCGDNEFLDLYGKCVNETDCEDYCQGQGGKQNPGIGVCKCDRAITYNDVCNSRCRAETIRVSLEDSGLFAMYNPKYGTTTYTDFQSTEGYTGRIRCYADFSCRVHSIEMNAEGQFISNMKPQAIYNSLIEEDTQEDDAQQDETQQDNNDQTQNNGRRAQVSTLVLINPVICLNMGETLIFDITSSDHFPVYVKDSLLNSNPEFDYGPFLELEKIINDAQTVVKSFGYTFLQQGTYTFADSSEDNNILIISVLTEFQQCDEPQIRERWEGSLSLIGATQDSDVTYETDWWYFGIFLLFVFIFAFFLLALHCFHRTGKKLAAIKQEKAELVREVNGVLTVNIMGVVGDSQEQNKMTFVKPEIFDQIQKMIEQNIELLRQKLAEGLQNEDQQVKELQQALRGLKNVLLSSVNPNYEVLDSVPVDQRQAQLPVVDNDESQNEKVRRQILMNPELSEQEKNELLSELQQNMQKLDAQLAEDRAVQDSSLKKRLEERNRRRRELQDKRKDLKNEQERLQNLLNDKMYDATRTINNENKKYDREKRKLREDALGNTAKDIYKKLKQEIQNHPEREQQLKDEYERQLIQLENSLSGEARRQHLSMLSQLEERKNRRLKEAEQEQKEAQDAFEENNKKLAVVDNQLQIMQGFDNESIQISYQPEVNLSEQEEKQIEQQFQENQQAADGFHDSKQYNLEKQKMKLSNNLAQSEDQAERNRILQEINQIDDKIQQVLDQKQAQQKRILEERLKQRRMMRKKKQDQEMNTNYQKDLQQRKLQQEQVSKINMQKIEEAVSKIPQDERIVAARKLLQDKHDQELLQLQAVQQARTNQLQMVNIRESIDFKAATLQAAQQHLVNVPKSKQQEIINQIVLDAETQKQQDFEEQWQRMQKQNNDELLDMLDRHFKEAQELMKNLGIQEDEQQGQNIEEEFKQRRQEIEKDAQQRIEALDQQREQLQGLSKQKQAELEKQLEQARQKEEINRAKRQLEEKQKREREDLQRRENLTQRQIEELIEKHQRELSEFENAVMSERERQKRAMREKLDLKRAKRAEQLKIPTELIGLDYNTAKLMQKWRGNERENKQINDDIQTELIRRLISIENIVTNLESFRVNNIIEALSKQAESFSNKHR